MVSENVAYKIMFTPSGNCSLNFISKCVRPTCPSPKYLKSGDVVGSTSNAIKLYPSL